MLTPDEAAALFPGATIEKRAEVLAKAGRISYDAIPYVVAHMQVLAEEHWRAAKREDLVICDGLIRQFRQIAALQAYGEMRHYYLSDGAEECRKSIQQSLEIEAD